MARFSEILYLKAKDIWEASHRHPFLAELADGTLDVDRFAFYMKQDYVYLIDYAKLFAYGSVKARDLETMGKFAVLLDSTLNTEMGLHRKYAEKFGLSRRELEETVPTPTTIAYTKYLLDAAASGTMAELVAVLLPCMWGYNEIGLQLAKHSAAREHPLYGEWVSMYASQEFTELTQWTISLMNRLAEGLPGEEKAVLINRFVTASRFEYLFWDMAYRKEEWPV